MNTDEQQFTVISLDLWQRASGALDSARIRAVTPAEALAKRVQLVMPDRNGGKQGLERGPARFVVVNLSTGCAVRFVVTPPQRPDYQIEVA